MNEPTKEELKALTLELFELLIKYKRGHDGKVESIYHEGCDCFACAELVELVERLDAATTTGTRLHHRIRSGRREFYSG